ncbi:MAG: glutathione binding-like protein, partial [Alphaproteobacteria bacterium]
PLACSMATRIALYAAGAEAKFTQVDLRAKRTADGADFFAVNPMGQVPALRLESGEAGDSGQAGDVVTENPVVLQYVADRFPEAGLTPRGGRERYRLQQWLNFIATELHKGVFMPLLIPNAPAGAKEFARALLKLRLDTLDRHLQGRDFLLERFSVADAYLVTVLNWSVATAIDLGPWPAVRAYFGRMHKHPAVAKAFAEERALYEEEQKRRAAA